MAVDPDVEEVRVALALNGGVSLAVWMGGCAVELDRARRTAAGGDDGTTYGVLCRAFRRELVIDVMTGSSAGGINGALLAAAMTTGGSIEPGFVRDRWLKLGDFSELLQPLSNGRPESLMRGDYFAEELARTFKAVMGERPVTGLCPALDITSTDLAGTSLQFRDDWGGILHAREHRIRFHFRVPAHYDPDKLAVAARASASFPVAFEPWDVTDERADGIEALAQIASPRWVVDGGLLDNAPIRAALNLIPTRPAARQVKRFLCYLNGDPEGGPRENGAAVPPRPPPAGVIGAAINLPRTAPFADHLLALQDLSRRSRLTFDAELSLLALELGALEATATALLPTYRRRRRLRALQEMLSEPGEARQAFEQLERARLELPWIPTELAAPADGEWRWGFETSRRVQHLALDLIRVALPAAVPGDRRRLLQARAAIDDRASAADTGRDGFTATVRESMESIAKGKDVAVAVQILEEVVAGERAALRQAVVDTAGDLLGVADLLGTPRGVDVRSALFGADGADPIVHLLRRALAVEVVRRSFFDVDPIDDGQEIAFAQLTPEEPDLLFTGTPLSVTRMPTADQKLCGTLFAHFSGFYRRSWRANDFLWGRLDAATRITEMLVSSARTQALAKTDQEQPWIRLASELCGRGAEHDELIDEALTDAKAPPGASLRDRLHDALRDDLTLGTGRLTRVIAARAAQFEVLQEELQQVVKEATGDVALGCSPHTLGLDGLDLGTPAGALAAIKRLRENPQDTFPKRLGRVGDDEWSSDLGVRTGTRAGLVGLALARHAGRQAATPLTPLRALLLPMAGAVSGRILSRLAVIAAFWAAAMYLSARIADTDAALPADLGTVELPELILAVIAWLVVAGTVLVPGLRAWMRRGIPRVWAGVAALIMALAGGVGAALLCVWFGPLSWAQLVVAPGAADPPWSVLAGPLILGLGVAAGPALLRGRIKRLAEPAWHAGLSLLATFASAAIVVWWSWDQVTGGIGRGWWQETAAWGALVAAPVTGLMYFVIWPVLRGRLHRF
jgi:predicted acylesterase/phospholipase RssA